MRHFRREHLDGDGPLEREVFCKEHRAHPTAAHHLADPVPPLEGLREPSRQILGLLDRARTTSRIRDISAAFQAELAAFRDRAVAVNAVHEPISG